MPKAKVIKSGYKIKLSDSERKRRSEHLKSIKAKELIKQSTL